MVTSVNGREAQGGASRRPYDASSRRARAAQRREKVVAVARQRFLSDGFAATTMAGVATEAGVSVESVYKGFGSKAGLLREVWNRSLAGSGPSHAERRSDAASRAAADGDEIIRSWARFAAEVGAVADPIYHVVERAAHADPEAALLHEQIEAERAARMDHNVGYLVDGGHLRAGITQAQARDVLLLYTTFFDRLVNQAGWTPDELSAFVERGLRAHLLP